MRKKILKTLAGPLPTAIIFILILRFGGNLGGNPAINYNNRITANQNAVALKMIDMLQSFDSRNPENMNKKLELLHRQIDVSLVELSSMEDFEGNTQLRDAAVDLITFYKSAADKEFVEMIKLLSTERQILSETDAGRLRDLEKFIINREAEYGNKLHAVQKEFARIHGLKFKIKEYFKK